MPEIVTLDVTTMTELKTVIGQEKKALVIYDVSTGVPNGLDVEVLIGMDSSISAMDSSISAMDSSISAMDASISEITTQVETLDDVDKANYAKSVEMIAHNATAPSPDIPTGTTKTYEFSSGGVCAWLANQVVEKGDKATVAFTSPSTFVRTFVAGASLKVDKTAVKQVLGASSSDPISQEGFSKDVKKINLTGKFNSTVNLWDDKDKDIFVGHLPDGQPIGTNKLYTTGGFIDCQGKSYFISNKNLHFYAFYDAGGDVIAHTNNETLAQTQISVPSNAVEFRCTVANSALSGLIIVADSEIPSVPTPYIGQLSVNYQSDVIIGNLFDINDPDRATGYTIGDNGVLGGGGTSAYSTTGFIDVRHIRGKKLVTNDYQMQGRFRFICAFDKDKVSIPENFASKMPYSYIIPMTVSFIRVSYYTVSESSLIIQAVEESDLSLTTGYVNKYEKKGKDKIYVFLPESVYVAVGRTIEIYNKQAVFCGNIDNYHIFWNGIGTGMNRKWSYTGAGIGAYDLYLDVYDNNMVLVGKARTKVRVVSATIATSKNVVYLGDSLSNNKPQNDEVKLLSDNKILSIGTLWGGYGTPTFVPDENTLRHEGRSGWSPIDYQENAFYTYNNANAEGAVEVEGVWGQYNPFWDGDKFSLLHYSTTYSKTVDGIVLFLGTNDIDLVGGTYARIIQMVQSIRAEYATMPIFVGLTLFRGSQDGIGKQEGVDGYVNTESWKLQEDWKVFRMQVQLTQALNNLADTNLHIIPISICHDSEYNFKNPDIMTVVNPRSTITEMQDIEATHPYIDGAGYLQFADIMFSTMVSKL